jgi:hypothetical protein
VGKLTSLIQGKLVAFDSAPLIYYLEKHPRYLPLSNPWVRTPDALQIATAVGHGAQPIVTNDNRWKRLSEIPVVVFDDYLTVAPE